MRIDVNPKRMKVKTIEHSIFTGVKYCLCFSDGDHSTVGDPFGYTPKYDYENAISVLWSKEELDKFRPNGTVHEFIQDLNQEYKEEIAHLKKLLPRASKAYVSPSTPSAEPVNLKQRYLDRINFLEENVIVFLEITFGAEGEDYSSFYA